MPPEIVSIAFAAAWPPVLACIALLASRSPWPASRFWGNWCWGGCSDIIGGTLGFIGGARPGMLPYVLAGTAHAVLGAVMWWLNRRRRKRAPRTYGAKSRALIAAVVAKMRETAKPRPVFRPQPQGSS